MANILVGVDGSRRGVRATLWATRRAQETGARLTLLTVVDPSAVRGSGVSEEAARAAAENALRAAKAVVHEHAPQLAVDTVVTRGKVVEALIDASSDCDMVVLGSHHGATVSESFGGAKGLRVSVSVDVPTAVIPSDWEVDTTKTGVLVGVGPDRPDGEAVRFGVEEALRTHQQLELVSVWGVSPLLERPARAMGGGLEPVGDSFQKRLDQLAEQLRETNDALDVTARAVEAASPARGLLACSTGFGTLVLGTHSRTTLGRMLFGSVTHGVLLNLNIPTIVVPKED